jgi:hypothetical protein
MQILALTRSNPVCRLRWCGAIAAASVVVSVVSAHLPGDAFVAPLVHATFGYFV